MKYRRTAGVIVLLFGLVLVVPLAFYLYLVTSAHLVGVSPNWVEPVIFAMGIAGAVLLAFGVRILARRRSSA
jgi:hypothetical protein